MVTMKAALTNCNLVRVYLLLNIAARTRHFGRVAAAEREETMQAHTTLLSAALGFALLVGPAWAADLPKEGTDTGTYSAIGTSKATSLGEGRWFGSSEEDGLQVGGGLLDHMTAHCWGVNEGMKTIGTFRGYCVATDPTGDQIAIEYVSDGKVDFSKPFTAINTITAGTGKYAGISAKWTDDCHTSEFKAPEGRYFEYCLSKGSYKLP
jgi:hypothetical protein